jgi:hypothetical protein
MCIVCVEMAKGKLNQCEAKRALAEVAIDPKNKQHAREVTESIDNAIREEEKKKQAAKNQGKL